MASNTHSDYPLAPVQFSRLTRRGVMLGLSLPQLVVLAVAVLSVVWLSVPVTAAFFLLADALDCVLVEVFDAAALAAGPSSKKSVGALKLPICIRPASSKPSTTTAANANTSSTIRSPLKKLFPCLAGLIGRAYLPLRSTGGRAALIGGGRQLGTRRRPVPLRPQSVVRARAELVPGQLG